MRAAEFLLSAMRRVATINCGSFLFLRFFEISVKNPPRVVFQMSQENPDKYTIGMEREQIIQGLLLLMMLAGFERYIFPAV